MLVLADASPIIALDNIGELNLLRRVYRNVSITQIVKDEVDIDIPDWIKIITDYDSKIYEHFLENLDPGEASSIAVCLNNPECVLIIDERKGRKIAKNSGIEIIGLLGVILKAQKLEKNFKGDDILNRLIKNGFRISAKIENIVRFKLSEFS